MHFNCDLRDISQGSLHFVNRDYQGRCVGAYRKESKRSQNCRTADQQTKQCYAEEDHVGRLEWHKGPPYPEHVVSKNLLNDVACLFFSDDTQVKKLLHMILYQRRRTHPQFPLHVADAYWFTSPQDVPIYSKRIAF